MRSTKRPEFRSVPVRPVNRRQGVVFCLLLILAPALTSRLYCRELRLAARVEVNSESIRLGDLADLDGTDSTLEAIDLGYAPLPGHYRWISRGDVERALRASLGELDVTLHMPERILITRGSRLLEEAEILPAVEGFLAKQWPHLDLSIDELRIPAMIVLPEGPLELQISRPGHSAGLGWVSLEVKPIVDGRELRSHWVRMLISARQRLAVATRRLEVGRKLQSGDLELVEQSVRQPGVFVSSTQDVEGFLLRRSLNAGEPLLERDIRAEVVIGRGDLVSLSLRGRNFNLKTSGRARKSGVFGEVIPVENLTTRRLVTARITGAKTAEVESP